MKKNSQSFVLLIASILLLIGTVLDGSGRLLYDKLFKIKPQKAYMVVIVGTPNTPTFKVVIKAHNKKLK